MALPAFLLVLAAAVVHALWNLAAKRVGGNVGVFWLGLCLAGIILVPVALLSGLPLPAAAVPYILATGFIHAIYFGLLAASYRHGEMAVVYSLARGTGVAGTALVAAGWLGETISPAGAVGIGLVCCGVMLTGFRELVARSNLRSCGLAVLVGIATTGYSIVDKLGVGAVDPLVYIAGLATGAALFLAPYLWLRYGDECREAWRTRKLPSAFIGLGSMLTYLVILYAFQLANASYVVAVRELSIVVVAVLSAAVLKEPWTLQRGVSILAILAGVVLVKIA